MGLNLSLSYTGYLTSTYCFGGFKSSGGFKIKYCIACLKEHDYYIVNF